MSTTRAPCRGPALSRRTENIELNPTDFSRYHLFRAWIQSYGEVYKVILYKYGAPNCFRNMSSVNSTTRSKTPPPGASLSTLGKKPE